MAVPAITSITPSSGPAAGGTTVTIQGSGFTGATSVLFGGASGTGIVVQGDTVVIATSPQGTGQVNVGVTSSGGTSPIVPESQFTYAAAVATSPAGSGYIDPALTSQLVQSLVTMMTSATSPEATEAQNIIMRRIALEGDVVGSRMLPLANITQVAGIYNLLTDLHEDTMREQMLAGILGVAGPNPPLGWTASAPPLSMVSVTNDRPAGVAQPTIPLTVAVRSDFVSALQAALATIHASGGTLPFAGHAPLTLPEGYPGATAPSDVLPYLGRELFVAASAALVDPATDPVAILRPSGTTDPYVLASNVLAAASVTVTPANYDALECTTTTSTTVTLSAASFIMLAPILAAAGFYPAAPLPVPANSTDTSWATLTNITGLQAGTTKLGDELALLYDSQTIASSVFATMLGWTWNGTAFAA